MIVQQGLEALKEHWPQVLLATLGLYTLFSLVSSYLRPRVVDVNTGKPLPIVGGTTTYRWFFPKLRSRIKSFNNAVEWVAEGYEKYSKNGKAFMFHGLDGDMVVLPHTLIPEMKNLPVKVADIRSIDNLGILYTFDKHIAEDLFHVNMIKKDLTSKLGVMTPAIVEELEISMKRYIEKMASEPDAEGYQELPFYEFLLKVVAQTTHRAFIGEELCREEEYLDICIKYAITVIPLGFALNFFPQWIWPIVGPVLCFPLQFLRRRAQKHLEPVILRRIAAIREGVPESERPNDLMQWIIEYSLKKGGDMATVKAITYRLLTIAFAAIHTTSLSSVNAFYDLAWLAGNTPAGEKTTMETLREEVMSVFPPPQHDFNKRQMQRLYNLDAFMKETVRLNLLSATHSERLVRAKNGYTTSTGVHLPRGAAFCFPGMSQVRDNSIYENGPEHNYKRFYRGDKNDGDVGAGEGYEELNEKNAQERKLDRYMVTITDDYPCFGIGMHACPGRFFAANELRILMSWFLVNYDLKPVKERPETSRLGVIEVPNTTARLQIRSRK